jgi:hypothetical protein
MNRLVLPAVVAATLGVLISPGISSATQNPVPVPYAQLKYDDGSTSGCFALLTPPISGTEAHRFVADVYLQCDDSHGFARIRGTMFRVGYGQPQYLAGFGSLTKNLRPDVPLMAHPTGRCKTGEAITVLIVARAAVGSGRHDPDKAHAAVTSQAALTCP